MNICKERTLDTGIKEVPTYGMYRQLQRFNRRGDNKERQDYVS